RIIQEEKKANNSNIIKGNTAYPGKIEGVVKIINSTKDLDKMEEGNVLVSIQTMPELLPAMKKASAFITNIGGITSHAAIMSREMKVPCVVGTKIATQILKDEDMVEVDADNGIIRVIK
ncbi:phosphoenolpyruvate synthase, partial [bacterium]|nr:phosphoenolpyruvate synthase [bacterium]